MREKIDEHETRIIQLEQNQEEFTKNIQDLKKHQQDTTDALSKINSNVLTANNDQKELLGKLIGYHFEMKTQELSNKAEIEKQEIHGKTEVSKLRWQTVTGLLGAGGVVVVAFQWLITVL